MIRGKSIGSDGHATKPNSAAVSRVSSRKCDSKSTRASRRSKKDRRARHQDPTIVASKAGLNASHKVEVGDSARRNPYITTAKADVTKNVAGAARTSHAAAFICHARADARLSQKRRVLA
jgi:hypothetical protein